MTGEAAPVSVAAAAPAGARGPSPLGRWLFEPVPLARLAAFRTLVYLFVVYDVLGRSDPVWGKAQVAADLYRPLLVARLLPFPEPTPWLVAGTGWTLVVLAAVAAALRRPRAIGFAVFVLYFQWMLLAMSYGKVDHDRLGILVALALLPTAGRAAHGERGRSEAAGWVFRMVQLAVVATYFLAAWAKLRYGGVGWLWGSTLSWAIQRRGTAFSTWLLAYPLALQSLQVLTVAFEAASPLIFVLPDRARRRCVLLLYAFHGFTALALSITFAPHLVAMASFLRVERITPVRWGRRMLDALGRRPHDRAEPVVAHPTG